ncbi:MAG: Hsp20/alpha crystallin family protein [Acidobacteriota bacterium]
MSLMRWQPDTHPLFSSLLGDLGLTVDAQHGRGPSRFVPPMDVRESDDSYVFTTELPGLTADDVLVELESQTLTISGEKKLETEEESDGTLRRERRSGQFRRSVTLPENVDGDGVTAAFENGVLTVRVTKKAEERARRIAIEAA